ncbi:type I phosphomannose isomerase catalytic subunit [Mycoplasmopsis cricetuli]|uniref:type I phosphomannose isomerase catalytic subunit n=1 Tax=Mycoplasmopsis cricetuli TaxID=171283 RepID=UPI000472173F|nr:type I phosphomannose isomerase catalytic subunit [Mycoplasmopsis cricetuli]
MDKIIFLKPYFKTVLWANQNLKFLFNLKQANIGEAWLISAVPNCESIILNSKYSQMKLSTFFKENKIFFDNYQGNYPNLTKFIDAKDKLSIQVHPDDKLAKKVNSFGKDECWYVLNTNSSKFILGLKSGLKKDIIADLKKENINKWAKSLKIQNGDFIYVQAGLVHAIPEQTLVYELQQSSDITYRISDYNRIDFNGKKRQLHIEEASKAIKTTLKPKIVKNKKYLIKNKYFNLQKIKINEKTTISLNKSKWCEVVVVDGEGFVDNNYIKKGQAFLVSHLQKEFTITGKITILINFIN